MAQGGFGMGGVESFLNGAGVGRRKDVQTEETTTVAAKALKGSQGRARDWMWAKISA